VVSGSVDLTEAEVGVARSCVLRISGFTTISRLVVLNEVDAVKLAVLIDHVVAFELLDLALLLVLLELADLLLQLVVVDILGVPVGNLVELKQVTKFHFFYLSPLPF